MRFMALEKVHHLHDGYRCVRIIDGRNLLLFQHDGQIHIIENQCPHAGARMERATIDGAEIRCPWHGMAFDIDTGKGVACGLELVKYAPAYEEHSVGILLDD